jgi:hypothetical protein
MCFGIQFCSRMTSLGDGMINFQISLIFVHDCSKPYGEFDYVNVYEKNYEFVCCIMKEGKCMVGWTTFGIIFVVFFGSLFIFLSLL